MTGYVATGDFIRFDIKAADVDEAEAFCEAAFGWWFATDRADWRQARKIHSGAHEIGSIGSVQSGIYPPGTPPHIACYIEVEDAAASVSLAERKGARVIVPPFEAGDLGRIATVIDPQGNPYSVWERSESSAPSAPGAVHAHVLLTPNLTASVAYYVDVCGWLVAGSGRTSDIEHLQTPSGRPVYLTATDDETPRG